LSFLLTYHICGYLSHYLNPLGGSEKTDATEERADRANDVDPILRIHVILNVPQVSA